MSKVKKWLASQAGDERLSATDAVTATADITKEALRVDRGCGTGADRGERAGEGADGHGLQGHGRDPRRDDPVLERVSTVTGGGLLKPVSDAQAAAMWEMNQQVVKQVLKGLSRKR